MWALVWFTVFLAHISKCVFCSSELRMEPKDLNVITGENITITCTIENRTLRMRYNASNLVFKFELLRNPSRIEAASSSKEDCDYPADGAVSNETDSENFSACNVTGEDPSECDEDLSEYEESDGPSMKVHQSYVKVVSRYKAQLKYPRLTERFNDGILECCIDDLGSVFKRVHILVGERPYVPIVSDFKVKNWKTFEFHWRTEKKNDVFATTYMAWYKNSSFEDFIKCPTVQKQCAESCEVDVDLGLDRDLSAASRMIFKVNATNSLGNTTIPEAVVDLYDIVTPDPAHEVSVAIVNSSACIKFKSPKFGAEMIYEILFHCSGQQTFMSLLTSNASILDKCVSDLPAYTDCSVSIRTKPYSYGLWGEWSDQERFTMPQKVPLAAPDICQSCFEVLPINDDKTYSIRVFPKPLPRAIARGRVITYRAALTMHNRRGNPVTSQNITFNADNSGLDISGLDLKSSYGVTVVAATEAGYNESIIASPLVVNLMDTKKLQTWPRNITAFIVNSTTVRMSWLCGRPKRSGFTVVWCRVDTLNRCKDPLQWSRVSPNVTRFDVGLPAFDLLNYMFGVAVETADGHSSGIVWTKCLYNLSRVSGPPQIDSKVNGTKVLLRFSKNSECNSGFPYAYRVEYCPMSDNSTKCHGGSATALIVEDDTWEVNHLAVDTKYLFIVSSLSVAGPSLSNNTIQVEIPSKIGNTQNIVIGVAFVVGGIFMVTIVLVACFHKRITNCWRITIAPPPVVMPDNRSQRLNSVDYSEHYPGYADIGNGNLRDTSVDVHENRFALNNGWSSNLDSSSDLLIPKILRIVPDSPHRGRRITENNEDDNVSVASDNQPDNYQHSKLLDKPDVVPSSPPVEPSFPFDSSAPCFPNSIALDLGDVGNELHGSPEPPHFANAVDGVSDGNSSSNLSSCGYAVGRISDRQSGPSLSTADDVSVQMPESGHNADVENGRLPTLSSVVIDPVDGAENSDNTRNVHPHESHPLVLNDSPDVSIDDDVISDRLQPYSSAAIELRPTEDSESDDDYNSSIRSSSDYAVANLKNKAYDPLLDTAAVEIICMSDGDDSDSNADEYAAVSLLNNKQIADSTDSLPQATNIPHLSLSMSAHTCDPNLSS